MLSQDQIASAIKYDERFALDLVPLLRRAFPGFVGVEVPFTPALVQRVADVQERLGLELDGKIGPLTRPVLADEFEPAVDAGALWPDSNQPDGRYAHYRSLCEAFASDAAWTRPVLLGLRGVRLFGIRTHVVRSEPSYDDAFVLLDAETSGSVFEFRGASYPYQTTSRAAVDLDRDGQPDVALIRSGLYLLEPLAALFHGRPALHVRTHDSNGNIPCYRDLNHDGYFSPEEVAKALRAQYGVQIATGVGAVAVGILFHPGFDDGMSSIGCQTASRKAIDALRRAGRTDYLLVDGTDAIERARQIRV
jgi:hypothetical protein